jgi:hypothetical protein
VKTAPGSIREPVSSSGVPGLSGDRGITAATVISEVSDGFAVSGLVLMTKSPITHHRHIVENITLHSPLPLLPESYVVHLPVIRVDQVKEE